MKKPIRYFLLVLLIVSSCSEKQEQVKATIEKKPLTILPFQLMDLTDMADFKLSTDNWRIVGDVYVDRFKDNTLSVSEGSGVLVNIPEKEKNEHLVTNFEHGDIEFECEVMMPVKSNSGIYFQSRYEIQLFDSWGVAVAKHGDMGGIYQRWDDTKEKGDEGFEGFPPKVNASKSPGLWQHLKVVFHAPKFDETGNKTKNAWFEEVWLNGALIHQNVEVSGPTRGGGGTEEVPKAPILIQGDHGPVAFRNMRYKHYEDKQVRLVDVMMKEYENAESLFPNLDSLTPIREVQTDSMSATMATGVGPQKLLSYAGKLKIPETGDYLFDYKLNRGGGTFLINNDTVISMNGNYSLDSLRISKVTLEKGEVPFQLIYNKHVPWQIGFGLYVEGPTVQKHALHAPSSLNLPSNETNPNFMIALEDEPVTQRGFWMHEGKKRTHCIAVGNPQGTHYVYDLELGSLLQVWNGDFMDATKMWQGRGEKQLGVPAGFIVSLHGDPELTVLENEDSPWPSDSIENKEFRQLGYEFDHQGVPTFQYKVNGSSVITRIHASDENRSLKRHIHVEGDSEIWHKIAEGKSIKMLPDDTYVINDESYFVDFSIKSNMIPIIRSSGGQQELLMKIPEGKHSVNYNIIW